MRVRRRRWLGAVVCGLVLIAYLFARTTTTSADLKSSPENPVEAGGEGSVPNDVPTTGQVLLRSTTTAEAPEREYGQPSNSDGASQPATSTAADSAETTVVTVSSSAGRNHDGPPVEMFGRWTDKFHGQRTMVLNEDGTGLMRIDLETIPALLYGSFLEYDLKWEWNDGVITFEMVGGRPEKTAMAAAKAFGTRIQQKVTILEDGRLNLQTVGSSKSQTLTRIAPPLTAKRNQAEPERR